MWHVNRIKIFLFWATVIVVLAGCRLTKAPAPVVTMVKPENNAVLTVGKAADIKAIAVSQSGIDRIEFYVNGRLTDVTDAAGEQSFTMTSRWTPSATGSFRLEVRAIDVNGTQSEPAVVSVSVGEPVAQVTVVRSTFTPVAEEAPVAGETVHTATPQPTATATVTLTPTPQTPTLLAKTDLNIRTGPSTEFQVVGILPADMSAEILGVNAEHTWWLVAFPGAPNGHGWASASVAYGTALHAENVPVVVSPPTPTPIPTATATPTPTNTPLPLPDYPIIHYFRADKLDIIAGETVLLQWDVSGADQIFIYPGGDSGVTAPGDMQVTPDVTTIYRLVASNARGNVEATVTITVSPKPVEVVYDFIEKGPSATWENGNGDTLPWNGEPDDPRGFVIPQENITLEDDTVPDIVLETHPQWVADGVISGSYEVDFEIKSGDKFVADVGFLKGATFSNGVTFKFCYFTMIDGECLADLSKSYDGELQSFEVDLSPLNGYNAGWFQLRVEANGNADQDWAIWLNPRIERP